MLLRKFSFRILAFMMPVILLLFIRCERKSDEPYRFNFLFLTEQYKPLNFRASGDSITGLAPEILKDICKALNIPFKVELMPWENAYSQALANDNAVLFSCILNSTRKDLFKWAGPIASLDWLLYSSSQNQVSLTTLDDAKKIGRIGVLQDYAITQYLIAQGFTNLVYCDNNVDAFDKLFKGDIDLFPSDRITAEAALEALNQSIFSVTSRLTVRTDLVYFAFNKKVPDDVVADFQKQIDAMKANGKLATLTHQWMNTNDVPGTLQIYTEQYPPITFRNSAGEITGFGSDIVSEIMHRNHLYSEVKLSLWSIGYDLALNNPNFCLFTMDRTPQRDSLFQWVGPIGTNTTFLYTRSGSGITISSIDEAKNLRAIGTVSSWFSDQYLRNLGFTNLVSDGDPKVMTDKLMQGNIDAFVCTSVTFPDILASLGYTYEQVVPEFSLLSSDYYISFSKNTPAATVSLWQSTLDAMEADGTYDAIYKKWMK